MIPFIFRPMQEGDLGYILETFIKGARLPLYSKMPRALYEHRMKPVALALIKRANVLVACLPEEETSIAGFIISEDLDGIPIVHWVAVRKAFKKQGLAKELLSKVNPNLGKEITVISHQPNPGTSKTPFTKTFASLLEQYKMTYDPFARGA